MFNILHGDASVLILANLSFFSISRATLLNLDPFKEARPVRDDSPTDESDSEAE